MWSRIEGRSKLWRRTFTQEGLRPKTEGHWHCPLASSYTFRIFQKLFLHFFSCKGHDNGRGATDWPSNIGPGKEEPNSSHCFCSCCCCCVVVPSQPGQWSVVMPVSPASLHNLQFGQFSAGPSASWHGLLKIWQKIWWEVWAEEGKKTDNSKLL